MEIDNKLKCLLLQVHDSRRSDVVDMLQSMVDEVSGYIWDLDLSTRCENALCNRGIKTLNQLVKLTVPDLMATRNFGVGCLKEVKSELDKRGLYLGIGLKKEDGHGSYCN